MDNYWSDYWSQGHITSFGQDIKNNYTGKLKQSWSDFAKELSPDSKVLDIGTGNGALIQLINTSSANQFEFIGVDKASVAKVAAGVTNSRILSNVSAESLPFSDNEFDAIVTQFAIEYSELALSIPELFRVLKPGGLFQVVCHEVDSDIVKPNLLILNSAMRVKDALLGPLKQLIIELKNDEQGLISKQTSIIKQHLESERAIHPYAIDATRFPDFYQFILNNRKIDLDRAYALFSDELNGLIFRLKDLEQAASNSKQLKQLLPPNLVTLKEALVDSNKEYIGTLYRGYKG